MVEGIKPQHWIKLVSHVNRISLLLLLGLLAQGCAPWQPTFPTPVMQASRCGGAVPCAPCGDSPGLGRCFHIALPSPVVRMTPTHGVVETPEPAADEKVWDCKDSAYEGDQIWTCHEGLLNRCEGGKPVQIHCGRGCESVEMGEDDTCAP